MSEQNEKARVRALTAARLLSGLEKAEKRMAEASEHEKLELAVSGGFSRYNADVEYTVKLATANALTAIALLMSGFVADGDEGEA